MASIKTLLILATIIYTTQALYEDQIGKFDWKKTHLGKLKHAAFDSVKRIVVATEESVLASLSLKNGQIVWRQLLERGSDVELLKVDGGEVLTVSGTNGVYYIRTWDVNSGTMLTEWSMTTERLGGRWVWLKNGGVVHVITVPGSHLEITSYNEHTGANKGVTSRLSTPWLTADTKCVVAGGYWTCLGSDNYLYLINLDGDFDKVQRQGLSGLIGDINAPVTIYEIDHHEPAVLLRRNNVNRFIYVGDNFKALPFSLEHNVISVSNGDEEFLIQMDGGGKSLTTLDINGEMPITTDIDATEELYNPSIVTGICRGANCRVLITCDDDSVSLLQLPSGKIQWTRDEALASIVNAEFIDLPLSEADASIEREFNEASNDIISMFTRRILSQLKQLTMFISGQQTYSEKLVRDMFGLHKLIILVSKVGKLFAVHTMTGEIIWSKFVPELKAFNVMDKDTLLIFEQRTSRYAPLPAQMVVIGKNPKNGQGVMYQFDPITGKPLGDTIKLNYKIKQAMLLPYEDKEHVKGLILLANNNQAYIYPDNTKTVLHENAHSLFLYNVDAIKSTLNGYTLHFSTKTEPKATPTWTLNLANSKIIAISTRPAIERVHSQGRVLADRSVFYKYVNPNLIAVATVSPDPLHKHVLTIYLVDGVTGLIVHSAHHKRANTPVHMVHSENWLVYSYFSERFRRYEITAIELYEGARQSNSTAFSSHALSQLPHPESLSYILPVNPVAMIATLTERGITNKHLLIALTTGAVIELPWAYLEPRGPHLPSNPEEGYIPYMPELPNPSEAIINYNQTLARVRNLHVSPARLESTSLVIVYGLDIFYTRVTPSKTFDVLKEDFDHWLIVMVLVALTLASYLSKVLSIRKALKQVWK